MRILVAVSVLCLSHVAHADRHTVMSFGGTFDATSLHHGDSTSDDVHINGGSRLSMSFEDAPLAYPDAGFYVTDTRIVPELFAGFIADDVRAKGYIGAGLRAELQLARTSSFARPFHMAVYLAGRGKIIGKHQSAGGEFMLGEYISSEHGCRLGWEAGIGVIKRADLEPAQSPELEALVNVYVGWAL